MTVTLASPFKAAPTISREGWLRVLRDSGSLAAVPLWRGCAELYDSTDEAAAALYDYIVSAGHDPNRWLAIGMREHRLGTDANSVLWRNDTRSWTNARSVRHPAIKRSAVVITDSVRKSQYVRYANVFDSVTDGIYRLEDPSYVYVERGADTIGEVFALWTEDPEEYGAFVVRFVNEHADLTGEEPPMTAQIPGFAWLPADGRHHTKGRTAKIRGGAQHYSAGSDSRTWLTTSPNSEVSATFLVRHHPTLEDRGWQLVRIEDTPHTTASANPYTVSIEYEHDGKQPIPDSAYEVLAQTWADVTRYLRERPHLGALDEIKGHKEWVNNPSLICPDGIDVPRIVRRWRELIAGQPPQPRDPMADIVADPWGRANPWGTFYTPRVFATDMIANGLAATGHLISGMFVDTDGKHAQYTERARLEWNPDPAHPAGGYVTRELLGLDALGRRHPDRDPRRAA